MEKAGVADRKPGDWAFKYSTAVYGTIVDGAKWIDDNIGTLYKPSGEKLYEEGTAVKMLTEAGYKQKDEKEQASAEPPEETDVLKMNYDQSIEHIRDIVKGLKGMNKFEVIDRLFQLNGLLQKQKGFKKTDYSKALNDVMIGLHTDSKKYK